MPYRTIVLALLILSIPKFAWASTDVYGTVLDPQGLSVVGANVTLSNQSSTTATTTNKYGHFEIHDVMPGSYHLTAQASNFVAVSVEIELAAGESHQADLQFARVTASDEVMVVASQPAALTPDPSEQIVVHDEVLDANPGRPGAPISIPGLPIETASGGIKAPQYFAPGVAGDHGEPIGQYFQVGDFLFPNNLPANAHGNGYSDPNSLITAGIGAVHVDGGAFNVREGNHAVNLAAAYVPRDRVEPFLQLTADNHDVDLAAGWSPPNRATRGWVGLEAGLGNGYLARPEHRKQFKVNAYRAASLDHHELTLFAVGYYGFSNIPGLIPRDVPTPGDTIDPRQRDRTSTAIVIANDTWQFTEKQQLQLSGFFRAYDLQLRSNFGDGLIQQSEFRTVAGGNATYIYNFRRDMSLLAGFDLRRDAPRGLDLKHADAAGVFQPVTANDLTLGFATPYASLDGGLSRYFHYDVGIRQENVFFNNVDKIIATDSFTAQQSVTLPKATFTISPPGEKFMPNISLSVGEGFHTNDPRIGVQDAAPGTILAPSHAAQLVLQKEIARTVLKVTLARVTDSQELAKLDPDTGLQQDVGPSVIKSVTLSARRSFHFGYVQGSFARADARDRILGAQIPEAPRLIWDAVAGINHLPFGLRAHTEVEYVGVKFLGNDLAGNTLTATPVREIRGSLLRSFNAGRLDAGLNFLSASGFTGQTVETLQLSGDPMAIPRVVGVPLKSYVSASFIYHLGRTR